MAAPFPPVNRKRSRAHPPGADRSARQV